LTERKIVKQASGVYTVTIPKNIIESKGWEDVEFEVKLNDEKIILKKVE